MALPGLMRSAAMWINSDNAIDTAHRERCPLPFQSCMIDDCIKRGKTIQEGGAIYNFTGPQGFGIANMTDSLYAIKKLVFEEKKVTLADFKEALKMNFGKGLSKELTEEMTTRIAKSLAASGKKVGEEVHRRPLCARPGPLGRCPWGRR